MQNDPAISVCPTRVRFRVARVLRIVHASKINTAPPSTVSRRFRFLASFQFLNRVGGPSRTAARKILLITGLRLPRVTDYIE
jgi:hypothetical protein